MLIEEASNHLAYLSRQSYAFLSLVGVELYHMYLPGLHMLHMSTFRRTYMECAAARLGDCILWR